MTSHNLATIEPRAGLTVTVICAREMQRRSRQAMLATSDRHIACYSAEEPAMIQKISRESPDIVFVLDSIAEEIDTGVSLVQKLRKTNYGGYLAFVAEDPCVEQIVRVFRSGADDYLVSGKYLSLESEIERIESKLKDSKDVDWNPEAIGKTGFFRSLGLSACQIELLIEFARDFPKGKDLAKRVGQNQVQVRKKFSKIYECLKDPLAVETQSQLTQLLSVFAILA